MIPWPWYFLIQKTFLFHPYVSIFRIFNKLNNITRKSVLSPASSPFSCQRSWGWGGFFLASLLPCYLTWLENQDLYDSCDGKRNTVTITQKGQYVFGGYTDIPWGKNSYWFLNTFKGLECHGCFTDTLKYSHSCSSSVQNDFCQQQYSRACIVVYYRIMLQ